MYGKIGQFYNVAGGRKNKEDRLNQERPSGRNLKENNGHDLGGHGRRRKQTQKVLMSKSQGRSDTEPGDKKTWKKKKQKELQDPCFEQQAKEFSFNILRINS